MSSCNSNSTTAQSPNVVRNMLIRVSLFSMILLLSVSQIDAQISNELSKVKLVDTTDLSWHHSALNGKSYFLKAANNFYALRFSETKPLRFVLGNESDSTVIAKGTWGLNPGGWLVLTNDQGATQKYAVRKFVNFTFIMRDSEVDTFEEDFKKEICGLPMVKVNGQIQNMPVIEGCWRLAEKYFSLQE